MEDNSKNVCRLCFENCDSGFDVIEETIIDQLFSLQIIVNFSISDEHVMCLKCSKTLQECYDFKMTCLNTEDRLYIFLKQNNSILVDLQEFYLREECNKEVCKIPDGQSVCRFCLKLVKYFTMLEDRDKENLEIYFPELDLAITSEPVICVECYKSLQSCICFISNYCFASEKRINAYCDGKGTINNCQDSLNDVFKSVDDCDGLDIFKIVEENCEDGEPKFELKCEDSMVTNGQGFNSKEGLANLNVLQGKCENSQDVSILNPTTPPERIFMCTICAYRTKRKCDYQRHMLTHKDASEIKMFQCESCPYQAKRKSHLQKHQLIHKKDGEVPTYHCDLCTYQTKHKDYLRHHMLVHRSRSEVKIYKCDLCGIETKHKNVLRRHVKSTHKKPVDLPNYKCEICGYQPKTEGHLQQHMLTHKNEPETKFNTFVCEICHYKTKRKTHLRRHMLTHGASPEQSFKCHLCSFRAKHRDYLQKHMLRHRRNSEIGTFKCTVCDFVTNRQFALNSHMSVHNITPKVTKFKCKMCKFEAKYRSGIQKHVKSHKNVSDGLALVVNPK